MLLDLLPYELSREEILFQFLLGCYPLAQRRYKQFGIGSFNSFWDATSVYRG